MRILGFADAEVTSPGSDGGVDVRARGAIAQVKHFTNSPVGAPAVQQLVGAARSKPHGLFYALNGFTVSAMRLAEDTDTALFSYSIGGNVQAHSAAAIGLLDLGFADWEDVDTLARREFLAALNLYGQRVADENHHIVVEVAAALKRMAELADGNDGARVADLSAVIGQVVREMQLVNSILQPFDGITTASVMRYASQFAKAQGLLVGLARKTHIDFDDLARRSREWRALQED